MKIDKYITALEELNPLVLEGSVNWTYLLEVLRAIKEDLTK